MHFPLLPPGSTETDYAHISYHEPNRRGIQQYAKYNWKTYSQLAMF